MSLGFYANIPRDRFVSKFFKFIKNRYAILNVFLYEYETWYLVLLEGRIMNAYVLVCRCLVECLYLRGRQ
jgi:hypothetical protein